MKIIIISTNQSGFRSLHSTVTALLEATDNGTLINFKKAFDTVDKDILLTMYIQAYLDKGVDIRSCSQSYNFNFIFLFL